MDTVFAIKYFGALFAIMNPFLSLPIFLAMTPGKSDAEQLKMALQITCYCLVMCLIIAFAGNHIISFFGITINDFRVAGGLVLLGMAFSMLNGKELSSHSGADHEKGHMDGEDLISFYPLTFPIIVGPGTITTLVLYSYQADTSEKMLSYGAVLAAVIFILFVVLFFASSIGKILSGKMRIIVTRIMGMILAGISVEMITAGLKIILPGLA